MRARSKRSIYTLVKRLDIDIWSDIACPWCFIGKRHLETALQKFPQRDSVNVTWRAFELDPSAPAVRGPEPYAERLARKYGTSVDRAQAMIDRMTELAKADGVEFRFDRIRPGNTFDAHRLLHLAAERGLQDAVKDHFLVGYLTEGEPIGEKRALTELAVRAGLDRDEVQTVLASDRYASEVRQEEAEAEQNGINAVPFFVIGNYGLSGAQPAEVLLRAIATAWEEVALESDSMNAGM